MFTKVSFLALLLPSVFAASAAAQAAGPVNPSTMTWTAPTTNADATPLADLGKYQLRVAGPAASAPSYNPTVYPSKAEVQSTVQAPAANTTVKFGTDGSGNLVNQLGLTQDGQYWVVVTAVDIAGNESAPSAAVPFVRNRTAPSAPSGLQVNQ